VPPSRREARTDEGRRDSPAHHPVQACATASPSPPSIGGNNARNRPPSRDQRTVLSKPPAVTPLVRLPPRIFWLSTGRSPAAGIGEDEFFPPFLLPFAQLWIASHRLESPGSQRGAADLGRRRRTPRLFAPYAKFVALRPLLPAWPAACPSRPAALLASSPSSREGAPQGQAQTCGVLPTWSGGSPLAGFSISRIGALRP
jgi:hypothetical protein